MKAGAHHDMTRYCAFHKDHDHLTSEYKQLRRQIEDLIQVGELKELVLEMLVNVNASACEHATTVRQENRQAPLNIVTETSKRVYLFYRFK
jgi:hypothetical protein